MRSDHLLISLAALLLGFGVFLVGFFLFLTAFVPLCAATLQHVLLNHTEGVSYFGLSLMFGAVFFLTLFAYLSRRRYLLVEMGKFLIEDQVIAFFAKESLEKIFPGHLVECYAIIRKKKKIEILANVPYVEEESQEKKLHEIEKEIVATLKKQCQYDREFILNISFGHGHILAK